MESPGDGNRDFAGMLGNDGGCCFTGRLNGEFIDTRSGNRPMLFGSQDRFASITPITYTHRVGNS